MKKMRFVYALALAGLTVLNAHADPVAQEVGGIESGAEVVAPVMDFVAPTVSLQPEINVISAPSTSWSYSSSLVFTWFDPYFFSGGFEMSNVSVDFVATEFAAADVPEPATLPLLGLGLAGILAMRRKRQR